MCGFAGIARFDQGPIDRSVVEAMLERVARRGPDGRGLILALGCALAHARLSIVDLASGGQPMSTPASDPRGRLHVVFNGEIYNHRALRKLLEVKGHVFKSDHSDTEVLLHGYREWGSGLAARLEGMFAFAVWDEKNRKLMVARDYAGEKPLFVRFLVGNKDKPGAVAFGSTVSAVTLPTAGMAPLAVSPEGLLEYLRWGYTLSHSLFEGVQEVQPGTVATFEEGKAVLVERFVPVALGGEVKAGDMYEHPLRAVDAVHDVLTEAVEKMLDADVPVGSFLSGGIDSGLIAAFAQAHLKALGAPELMTFCMAMPDEAYDESAAAEVTAKALGTRHTTIRLDGAVDPIADLQAIIGGMGEPLGDASILPTYWVSKGARQHVKTLLSGDGGDELFGGYMRYRGLEEIRAKGWFLKRLPKVGFGQYQEKSKWHKLSRMIDASRASAGGGLAGAYASLGQLFSPAQIGLLAPHLAQRHGALLAEDPGFGDHAQAKSDPVGFGQRVDFGRYLPGDVLRKVDRASMHNALEVRAPFLDSGVIKTARRVPSGFHMNQGQTKWVLRELAARHLPAEIVARPKQGFALPIGQWFREDLKDEFGDILRSGRLEKIGVQRGAVDALWEEHQTRADRTQQVFNLVALAIWCEQTGI
jgi:asparagine synthase (glutamine-hydrolysing)